MAPSPDATLSLSPLFLGRQSSPAPAVILLLWALLLSPLRSPPLSSPPLHMHSRCQPFSSSGGHPPPRSVTLPSVAPSPTVTPFHWQAVSLFLCCHAPPPMSHLVGQSLSPSLSPCLPWPPPTLSPSFLGGRAPFGEEAASALPSRGPGSPRALCSGGHAPSPARPAIGRPGHVRPPRPRGNWPPAAAAAAARCARSVIRAERVGGAGRRLDPGVGPSSTGSVFPPVRIHLRYFFGWGFEESDSLPEVSGSSHIPEDALRGLGCGRPQAPSCPAPRGTVDRPGRPGSSHVEPGRDGRLWLQETARARLSATVRRLHRRRF